MNSKTKTIDLLTSPRPSHKASLKKFFFLEPTLVKLIVLPKILTSLQILAYYHRPATLNLFKNVVATHVGDRK